MYVVTCYNSYVVVQNMDHIIKLRKMVREEGYEDLMAKLDKFHGDLALFVTEKTWVIDFFGEYFSLAWEQ